VVDAHARPVRAVEWSASTAIESPARQRFREAESWLAEQEQHVNGDALQVAYILER
jgi:hypothetical protein